MILSTYRVAFRTALHNEVKGTDMMYEFLTNTELSWNEGVGTRFLIVPAGIQLQAECAKKRPATWRAEVLIPANGHYCRRGVSEETLTVWCGAAGNAN